MSTICSFYGITIRMYCTPREHPPAHFHVYYNEYTASISIDNLEVIRGQIPRKQLSLVIAWANRHINELKYNWSLAMKCEKPNKISIN